MNYIAFTDGSCDNLHPQRPGGAAYIILDKDGREIKRASKGFTGTSNNRMEILAIMSVVNFLPKDSSVTIYSDSQYSINVLNGRWSPVKNLDQIKRYRSICASKNLKVDLKWVKGHSGNDNNEDCDKMARMECRKACKGLEGQGLKQVRETRSPKAKDSTFRSKTVKPIRTRVKTIKKKTKKEMTVYKVEVRHRTKCWRKGDLEDELKLVDTHLFKTKKAAKEYIEDQLKGKTKVFLDYHKGDERSRCCYFTGQEWVNENSGETIYEYYQFDMFKTKVDYPHG